MCIKYIGAIYRGFPDGSDDKERACIAGDQGLIPGSRRSPGEGNTPVFLPGKSHGQRSLVGYSPCSRKELDTTEQLTLSHIILRELC